MRLRRRYDDFPRVTALPVANDYQADCFQSAPPCTATATEVRAALDADGNLLMPFFWRGVLTRDQGLPVPRLIRFRTKSCGNDVFRRKWWSVSHLMMCEERASH